MNTVGKKPDEPAQLADSKFGRIGTVICAAIGLSAQCIFSIATAISSPVCV